MESVFRQTVIPKHEAHRMVPELNGDFIQWLRGFYYSVEAGSLVGATSIMHRNQSALTYQIQSLENMYGVPLFIGTKGKRGLTPEGKFLYTKAIELFSEIDSIRSAIGQSSPEGVGEVRIAAPNSVLVHYLPKYVNKFRAKYPGSCFVLEGVSTSPAALRMLASRQTDFVISLMDHLPDNVESHYLFSSDIQLITPKTGPYALTTANLEQVVDFPFIAATMLSEMGEYVSSQLTCMGATMRNEIMSSDSAGALEFVAEGLGISFVRDFTLSEADTTRFNVIPMTPPFKTLRYGVVYRRGMTMNYLCEKFLQCLEQPVEEAPRPEEKRPSEEKCAPAEKRTRGGTRHDS